MSEIIAFQGEVMLAGWNESHTGGRKVTFWLPEETEEHPFKKFTAAKGKTAGHRFMAVLVEIGNDEQPVAQDKIEDQIKGGPLSELAGRWCKEDGFWLFLNKKVDKGQTGAFGEATARQAILQICNIDSRKELDHNPAAARIFHEQIRLPYNNWLDKQARQ